MRLPLLEQFIGDLRAIWTAESDNQRRMERAKPLLERLLNNPDLKAHSATWPSTEGRKNLLLYVDPDHHFVINAVVRAPGRTGSVHDHADAWVLYGMLDGSESLERYERVDDGSRPGYAEVRLASVTTGTQGKVDLVAPSATLQNMPGASSLTAVQYLDANAPKDGSVMAAFNPGLITESLLNADKIRFKFSDVAWVGSITRDLRACYAWAASGIKTWDDLKTYKRFNMGAPAPGTSSFINA